MSERRKEDKEEEEGAEGWVPLKQRKYSRIIERGSIGPRAPPSEEAEESGDQNEPRKRQKTTAFSSSSSSSANSMANRRSLFEERVEVDADLRANPLDELAKLGLRNS